MKILRENCEEIHIQGPEGSSDVRIANSYPSKASEKRAGARGGARAGPI